MQKDLAIVKSFLHFQKAVQLIRYKNNCGINAMIHRQALDYNYLPINLISRIKPYEKRMVLSSKSGYNQAHLYTSWVHTAIGDAKKGA
ncbi:MAG: hypothetical protein JKY54_19365 [Flavobacteriales bacterium]|nr:hypothetical protein [Flavobacteriales bacterium]